MSARSPVPAAPAPAPRRPGAALAGFAAVFLASLCFQLPFFDRWFSGMDEGHLLLFAEIAADGGTLYRDASFVPLPGAFYLLAGLFELFGPSVLVARWAVVVEFALFAAIAFALLRRALPAGWALAFVPLLWAYRLWSFPHWQMYSYSTTALLLLAASLALLLAHLASGRRAPLIAAGVVFGLGVFCKQDYGAAALLATLVTLGVAARTRAPGSPGFAQTCALFLGPAATVGALAGLHFLLNGTLADVIRFCVLMHSVGTFEYDYSSFAPPWSLYARNPALRAPAGIATHFPPLVWTLDWTRVTGTRLYRYTSAYELYTHTVLYAPWLLLGASALRQWRGRARLRVATTRGAALTEAALLATAAAFCALGHVAKPQDYLHWAVVTWPAIAVLLVEVRWLWRARRVLALALAPFALPALAAALAYTTFLAIQLRAQHPTPVKLARAAGLHVAPADAQLLESLAATVARETQPGDAIGVFPYFPLLHFLTDRRGPHRSGYIVWPVEEIERRDEALIGAMEAAPVRLVIYHHTQFLTLPPLEIYAPTLFQYLVDRFEIFENFSAGPFGYRVSALRRESGPPSGRPLLDDTLEGRLRTERFGKTEELSGAARDAVLRREPWPFRPVLALTPTAGGASVLSLPLHARPGERLRTAVGTHPRKWFAVPPSQATFAIAVVDGGRRSELYRRTLEPQRKLEERGWFEVDVPLEAFAGRDAVLELSTSTDSEAGETPLMAGFAEPRLVRESD